MKFVYYHENDMWVGWLEEYPDYRSQGETLDKLKENLKDIYNDLSTAKIPQIRKYGKHMDKEHFFKPLTCYTETCIVR